MAIVSISIPDSLLHGADRLIEERGFAGRSELVRACVRDFMTANAPGKRPDPRSATLTLVYPEGRERRFSQIRHEFADIVRTAVHGHARETCVEVFVLEGKGERVLGFADALRGSRDAHQVTLVFTDAWQRREEPPAEATPRAKRRDRGAHV